MQLSIPDHNLEAAPPFPGGLPQCFLQQGFVYGPVESTHRFAPAAGLGKARRKALVESWKLSGQFIVTLDQKNLLDSFVKDVLRNGSLPFTKVDPIIPTTIYIWRFSSPQAYVPYGPERYITTLDLERLPVRGETTIGGWALVDEIDQRLTDDPAEAWLGSEET